MPSADRFCNLTLDRSDWLAFVACLMRTGQTACVNAASAIKSELGDQERMEMDRELEKWLSVFNPAFSRAKPEQMPAMGRIICQLSAAKYTQVW